MTGTAVVGRTPELALLLSAIDDVAAGAGRVVIVEGEAGIGKSVLVQAAAARARESRLTVLAAAAGALDSRRPFGVLLDLLLVPDATCEGRRGWMRGLLFGDDPGGSQRRDSTAFQLRVGEGLLGLLEEGCSKCPTVVVIEDLHWADPSSLSVLHRLVRGLAQLPLALVCSVRPMPRSAELEQFLADVGAGEETTYVRLGPLTEHACAELVESMVGAAPGAELRRQVARAGGNPLFVTELVAALDREGAVELAPDGTASLAAASRLPSLRGTVLHHLGFFDPSTREVLALASVLGGGFSVHELSLLSNRPVATLAPALRAALEAGVLGEDGERLAFRHELVRDALHEDTPLALRTALYRDARYALGQSLFLQGDEAEHAADVRALVHALTTRAHALNCRGQLGDSERLLARAVALAESDGSREAYESNVHALLALVLADLDRLDEAEKAVAAARRAGGVFGPVTSAWMAQVGAVQAPFLSARFDDALAELDAVTARSEETGMAWNGVALALRALISLYRDGPDEAEPWMRRAAAAGAAGGQRYGVAWISRAHASYLGARGQADEALTVARDGWEACQPPGLALERRILGPLLAGLAASAGDRGLADAAATGVEALAAANPGVGSLAGAALHARGRADGDVDVLLAGLEAYRTSPRRYERARSAEDAAVALAGVGRRREAESVGGEALTLYDELRVGWESSRASAALRRAGLRPGVRGTRGRPSTGWAALTPTEEKVARLVGTGLSNGELAARLVLSRRTVETHVSHILRKLGLRSRSQLVAAAAQRLTIDGFGRNGQHA